MSLIKLIDKSIETLTDNMSVKYTGDILTNSVKLVNVKNLDLLFTCEYLELRINEKFKKQLETFTSNVSFINTSVFCEDSEQVKLLINYFNSYFNSMLFSEFMKDNSISYKTELVVVDNRLEFQFIIDVLGTPDLYKIHLNVDLLTYKENITKFYDYIIFLGNDKLKKKFNKVFIEGVNSSTNYILFGENLDYYLLNTSHISLNTRFNRIIESIVESEQDFIEALLQEQIDEFK